VESMANAPSRSGWMRESCGAYAAIEAGGEGGVGSHVPSGEGRKKSKVGRT
jgi:hypothetical protein